jgi:hypothetical protein
MFIDAGAAVLLVAGILAVVLLVPGPLGVLAAAVLGGIVAAVLVLTWASIRGAEWLGDQLAARDRRRRDPGDRIAAAAADAAAVLERAETAR